LAELGGFRGVTNCMNNAIRIGEILNRRVSYPFASLMVDKYTVLDFYREI